MHTNGSFDYEGLNERNNTPEAYKEENLEQVDPVTETKFFNSIQIDDVLVTELSSKDGLRYVMRTCYGKIGGFILGKIETNKGSFQVYKHESELE